MGGNKLMNKTTLQGKYVLRRFCWQRFFLTPSSHWRKAPTLYVADVAEYKGERKEVFRYGNQVYSTYAIQCLCNWMSASYSFDMIHFFFRAWNERRLQLGESLRKWCRPVTVTVTVMQMNIWKIVQLSFTELIYRLKDSGKFYVAWHTWETRIHHNHWYFSSLHHPQLMSG